MIRTRSATRAMREGVKKKDSGPSDVKKNPRPSNLRKEVKRKKQAPIHRAYMGIVGAQGSGRQTLAYRFNNLDGPVIQDENVIPDFWSDALFDGPYGPYNSSYRIRLRFFFIPVPEGLREDYPPLYWSLWDEFVCLLFVFDITNWQSFQFITALLPMPRYQHRNRLLVGNKSDRRGENPEEDLVPYSTAQDVVYDFDIKPYHEVSARNGGREVVYLFIFVRRFAIEYLETRGIY